MWLSVLLQMWLSVCWRNCAIPKRAGMKTQCADNKCINILSKHFAVGLCRNANYVVNTIEKLFGYGKEDTGIPKRLM